MYINNNKCLIKIVNKKQLFEMFYFENNNILKIGLKTLNFYIIFLTII